MPQCFWLRRGEEGRRKAASLYPVQPCRAALVVQAGRSVVSTGFHVVFLRSVHLNVAIPGARGAVFPSSRGESLLLVFLLAAALRQRYCCSVPSGRPKQQTTIFSGIQFGDNVSVRLFRLMGVRGRFGREPRRLGSLKTKQTKRQNNPCSIRGNKGYSLVDQLLNSLLADFSDKAEASPSLCVSSSGLRTYVGRPVHVY